MMMKSVPSRARVGKGVDLWATIPCTYGSVLVLQYDWWQSIKWQTIERQLVKGNNHYIYTFIRIQHLITCQHRPLVKIIRSDFNLNGIFIFSNKDTFLFLIHFDLASKIITNYHINNGLQGTTINKQKERSSKWCSYFNFIIDSILSNILNNLLSNFFLLSKNFCKTVFFSRIESIPNE